MEVEEFFGVLNFSSPCNNTTLGYGVCYNMPVCGFCYDMGMTKTLVIGCILPFVGICGLMGNSLSAYVYSRKSMKSSINVYLFALALSDITIIITSFFLFFCESMRKRSAFASRYFAIFAPFTFPLGMTAQSVSVFLTIAAAIDGFVLIAFSDTFKGKFCTRKTAKLVSVFVLFCAVGFNFPHWFEIKVIHCWSTPYQISTFDVCPTDLRLSETYYEIYYAYLYTIFMAIGPVFLLIVLNFVIFLILKKKSQEESESEESDIVTLILVVCLFIACNILPLTVNFLELTLNVVNTYLIDLSNFMVVMNSSCNFLIYYAFGKQFRRTLKKEFKYSMKKKKTIRFPEELSAIDFVTDKSQGDETFLHGHRL
ncbi:hypothetical protein FO519_009328 [Halicephalobus sp. NKZ332]|nr:hypothetical protein FO519_009328 [Halicephalobus sp. NKZ332]